MLRLSSCLLLIGSPVMLCAQLYIADPTFSSGDGPSALIRDLLIQPNGQILIAGDFSSYDGTSSHDVARLHADGTLDETFTTLYGFDLEAYSLALQPDGKILVGGNFNHFYGNGSGPCGGIIRLNPDGSADPTFNAGTGVDGAVLCITLKPNGNILLGGSFTEFNGTASNNIVELNADGSLSTQFDPNDGANERVNSIALLPDGGLMIGGRFDQFDGTLHRGLAKLLSDGTEVPGFSADINTLNFSVERVLVRPDGNILVVGSFHELNGVSRQSIALIDDSGSVLDEFDSGGGFFATNFQDAVLMDDGRVLVAGQFSSYQGQPFSSLMRVLADGSPDPGFEDGTGLDWTQFSSGANVTAVALQQDGAILVAGYFDRYQDEPFNGIGRLMATGTTSINGPSAKNLVVFPNPVRSHLSFRSTASRHPLNYRVSDVSGKIVREGHLSGPVETIDVSSLDPGPYQLLVLTAEGPTSVRFLKE